MSKQYPNKSQKGDESSSLSSDDRRGPGRPPGSKTQELPVEQYPAPRCPACNGTEVIVLRTDSISQSGETIDGQPFDTVTWRRIKCRSCDSVRILKTFRFVKQ